MKGVPQACPEALAQCGNSVSRAGARVAMPVAGGKALRGRDSYGIHRKCLLKHVNLKVHATRNKPSYGEAKVEASR